MIERLVLAFTDRGDWVLDPFVGVGTTAIAALMHGTRAVGAEVVPEYVRIAKERIKLAHGGRLRIRPMERPVYDPQAPAKNIAPRAVRLAEEPVQKRLFEHVADSRKGYLSPPLLEGSS